MKPAVVSKASKSIVQSAGVTLTVSQALQYFAASLAKPGNYPRLVRPYLLFCLDHKYPIDLMSFRLYAADKPANRVSPIRKFLLFYHTQEITRIVADPPPTDKSIPAVNELVLGFINDATTLRGDESKDTYIKSLNAFFTFLIHLREGGEAASFCGQTVSRYVEHLKKGGLSAFTINLRLSAIKQLANWVIKNRDRLNLNAEQVDALRNVDLVRGLTTERKFYKDSLSRDERDELLASIEEPADRAITALLVIEGLRTVEVTRLSIGDVDFDKDLLQVRGKGKSTKKDIKLFKACAQALANYLRATDQWPPLAHRSKPLFEGLKTYQIRYRIDKYLTRLALKRPRISAHSLRHTTGQLLIQQGVEPVHVQRHLRHELFETTQFYIRKQTEQDYYSKVSIGESNDPDNVTDANPDQ